jgi:glutamate-5-semialdehyde dehydrogenase
MSTGAVSGQESELVAQARGLAERARAASRVLARAPAQQRTEAILAMAALLETPELKARIALANSADVEAARAAGQTPALLDRLVLNEARLPALAGALREVASQPDPLGEVVEKSTRPNGITVERMRAPLGSVLMIYEARPNVTADAAALCLRSGNAALLRGGSEALQSNTVLLEAARAALAQAGLPEDGVLLVPPDRALLDALLQLEELIDLCIPRGGPGLIRLIAERSRIPVIKHYQGVCHLYVDGAADLSLAERLAVNGKAQRPGVCNALECLLVDASIAATALPRLARALVASGVELRCDARALPLCQAPAGAPGDLAALLAECGVPAGRAPGSVVAASPTDFGHEFLELKMAVAVVDGLGGALDHIARYGSRHTECIVTADQARADRFVREVDASCTAVNASSRFNDGGELGLGAEIGISTSKLHAYGPMGARELTCTRFVVHGAGQVRT